MHLLNKIILGTKYFHETLYIYILNERERDRGERGRKGGREREGDRGGTDRVRDITRLNYALKIIQ